jgi:hypothetical protein
MGGIGMKKYLISLVAVSLILTAITTAGAETFTATLTADNHYALYYGDGLGNVTYVGRNEVGAVGKPGTYNWSLPETWSFAANPGQYIYVAAWSDGGTAQGWIGQFVVSSSNTVLTDTTHWQVYLASVTSTPNDDSLAPTPNDVSQSAPTEMFNYINNANTNKVGWSAITNSRSNGSDPWGIISAINSDAKWIWGSEMTAYGSNYGEFQIFRTQIAHAPIPGALWLFGPGLVGLAAVRRRFKK